MTYILQPTGLYITHSFSMTAYWLKSFALRQVNLCAPYIIYFCSSLLFDFVKTQWRVIDFEYPRSSKEQTHLRIDIPPYADSFWASSGQSYCVLECQLSMWSQCLFFGVSLHGCCCDGAVVLETRLTCIYTTPDSTYSSSSKSRDRLPAKTSNRGFDANVVQSHLGGDFVLLNSFVRPDCGHSLWIVYKDIFSNMQT